MGPGEDVGTTKCCSGNTTLLTPSGEDSTWAAPCPLACLTCLWLRVLLPSSPERLPCYRRSWDLPSFFVPPSHLDYFWSWCQLWSMFTVFWSFQWASERREALSDALFFNEFLGIFSLFFYPVGMRRSYVNFNVKLSWFLQLSLTITKLALSSPCLCLLKY